MNALSEMFGLGNHGFGGWRRFENMVAHLVVVVHDLIHVVYSLWHAEKGRVTPGLEAATLRLRWSRWPELIEILEAG